MLRLHQQVVRQERVKKLYEITESSKIKEESSIKLEEYNEECIKLIFKSGIINKKQRSTQIANFHYLVTRDPKYKNKYTAFLEVMETWKRKLHI
jgi:geranylgeranyl pyrophosphate synthase